ncbi:MAG TPA: hypothetical protein VFP56_06835 [Candidatus Limnocylindrales bacterium]|nr:hypothetical protein [Candidatus Limnocylindrales bacterium]
MAPDGPAALGGLSNRTIIVAVALIALVVSFILNSGPASSGFGAGQQAGYIVGQTLIAALIAWVVLKYVLRRP